VLHAWVGIPVAEFGSRFQAAQVERVPTLVVTDRRDRLARYDDVVLFAEVIARSSVTLRSSPAWSTLSRARLPGKVTAWRCRPPPRMRRSRMRPSHLRSFHERCHRQSPPAANSLDPRTGMRAARTRAGRSHHFPCRRSSRSPWHLPLGHAAARQLARAGGSSRDVALGEAAQQHVRIRVGLEGPRVPAGLRGSSGPPARHAEVSPTWSPDVGFLAAGVGRAISDLATSCGTSEDLSCPPLRKPNQTAPSRGPSAAPGDSPIERKQGRDDYVDG
jgi:hypothetical protein